MASDRKRASNAANARKSTGPKTASGKQKASRNAQRHGLSQREFTPEQQAELRHLSDSLRREWPNLDEATLADVVDALHRRELVERAYNREINVALDKVDPDLPFDLRHDHARLAALPRLLSLNRYLERASKALRRRLIDLAIADV